MSRSANSRAVQRVDDYPGLFRVHISVLDVRAERVAAKAIDSVGDQQNFASHAGSLRPSFDEAHRRKINAGISAEISQRQTQSLGHRIVVVAELGSRLHSAVACIKDTD